MMGPRVPLPIDKEEAQQYGLIRRTLDKSRKLILIRHEKNGRIRCKLKCERALNAIKVILAFNVIA
jgi:hypothetical protein